MLGKNQKKHDLMNVFLKKFKKILSNGQFNKKINVFLSNIELNNLIKNTIYLLQVMLIQIYLKFII